jgi:hypothetical protein
MFALLTVAGCTAFKDNGPLTTYVDCPFPIDWTCPAGSAPHIVSGLGPRALMPLCSERPPSPASEVSRRLAERRCSLLTLRVCLGIGVSRTDDRGFDNPNFKQCAWLQEQGQGLGEWEAWAGAAGQPPATRPGPAAIYKKQFH